MTEITVLTEEEVYSLIVTGDLSRSAALNIIRTYGSRKVMEALEHARRQLPKSERWVDDAEIEMRITSCIEKLDQFVRASVEAIKGASA